jgi:hypothetical protein
MLVFLAADRGRLEDLEKAVRHFLAWRSINKERDALNLNTFRRSQAEQKLKQAEEVVEQRIPEAYQWLLVPTQPDPTGPIQWQQLRAQGAEPLAVRACRKLRDEELLITAMAPTRLRLELDRLGLWGERGHIGVRQLWQYFAQYVYMPRLAGSEVLVAAVRDGVASTSWDPETFAYAEGFDEGSGRYRGLRALEHVSVLLDADSLLVRPDAARPQLADKAAAPAGASAGGGAALGASGGVEVAPEAAEAAVRRFHGTVCLDPLRVNKEVADVVENVLQHLTALPHGSVEVTLEIQGEFPEGVPDHIVRTVTENARTLKFSDGSGFEKA